MRIPGFKSGKPNKAKADASSQDIGFGSSYHIDQRLINKDGSFNVKRTGQRNSLSLYQDLVEMPWPRFLFILVGAFVAVNAFFALFFLGIGVEELSGIEPEYFLLDFAHAFFFCVQTFTTVGYGAISPMGVLANLVASLVALIGLLGFALATGLFFARFSKPKAQLLFSDFALIAPYRDGQSLQFRIANQRNNRIINLAATVSMTYMDMIDGKRIRRFSQLPLVINQITLFPLNWTLVHRITPESPLYGKSKKDLDDMQIEIIILLVGYDDSFAQTVHVNYSYTCHEVLWGAKFSPMYKYDSGERLTVLNLDKINDLVYGPQKK